MEHFRTLPFDIKLDILSRLPTETVLECKLVCKPWRNLVSHSSFSQLHFDRLLNNDSGKLINIIFNGHRPRKAFRPAIDRCYYFTYNGENLFRRKPSIRRINFTPEFELQSYSIVGSCNGLVYLTTDISIVICNPITKEYVTLTEQETDKIGKQLIGFGYHPVTNEYKVVRVYLYGSAEIEVYTLGSGNGWRNVGKLDSHSSSFCDPLGVFANGALHWVDAGKQTIVAFNLAGEKLCDIPLPPISNCSTMRLLKDLRLGALGEYLMCRHQADTVGTVHIWLLKKKNGQGEVDYKLMTWSKEFTFVGMEPFAFTRSGSVLCYNTRTARPYFYWCDLNSSHDVRLMSFDAYILRSPFVHMNTLVSLKAIGEENTETMELSLETISNG